jgi:hypothetical protein
VPLARHHATAFLGLPTDHVVEELRRTWPARPSFSRRTSRSSTPRTSRRGPQAWAALAGAPVATVRVAITGIAITAHDGDRWPALRTIPLTGSRPTSS